MSEIVCIRDSEDGGVLTDTTPSQCMCTRVDDLE